MKRFLKENSLSIVLFSFFLVFAGGQALTGHREYNSDLKVHGEPPIRFSEYLTSSHFGEALFENWESEFLQMSAYVVFTIFLFQRGSSESKKPRKEKEDVDRDPRQVKDKSHAPWPVRAGGLALKLYEHSLSIALVLLFLASFLLHAFAGAKEYNNERQTHGDASVSVPAYMTTARFWFESFQNWQSEFLAVGSIVLLSVFLRQKGSPESKPVAAPHFETPGA